MIITSSTTWVLADESDGPAIVALVVANTPSFEKWPTLCLDTIESVKIPESEAHNSDETGWSVRTGSASARDVSVYVAAATVRSIANVDPIRADYVIREWNDEEYYSQRSCHEEVNALLKTRRFARKALHQRKSIIVVWTRQLTPPMEAEAK